MSERCDKCRVFGDTLVFCRFCGYRDPSVSGATHPGIEAVLAEMVKGPGTENSEVPHGERP